MKNFAIYFDKQQMYEYLLETNYREAYNKIVNDLLHDHGIESYIILEGDETANNSIAVNDRSLYPGNGIFPSLTWVRGENFDHSKAYTDELRSKHVVNESSFEKLCNNKLLTKEVLKRYTKPDECADYYICKPINGRRGESIEIVSLERSAFLEESSDHFIEPLIDSSKGDSELGIEGIHDIRILCVGTTPTTLVIRTPPEGSYLANVHRGGSIKTFDLRRDLREFNKLSICNTVYGIINDLEEDYLKDCSMYSIDLMKENDSDYYLLELNSFPGIRPEYNLLIDTFVKNVGEYVNNNNYANTHNI